MMKISKTSYYRIHPVYKAKSGLTQYNQNASEFSDQLKSLIKSSQELKKKGKPSR